VFTSIIVAPFSFASRGIKEAGIISPVVPTTKKTSAVSASANDFSCAFCGICSPKKTKSGLSKPPHSGQSGGIESKSVFSTGYFTEQSVQVKYLDVP